MAALALALMAAATAQASIHIVGNFVFPRNEESFCDNNGGCTPNGPGSVAQAVGAAVNGAGTAGTSPGDIYVLDGGGNGNRELKANARVQQFSAADQFVRLWGPGVVKSGPGNADEMQAVRVDATAGAFRLGFGANTTADIPAGATAAEVKAALNGLASIGPGGVSVSGGPGGAGGTTPYLVSFDGSSLAGNNQPLLKATDGSTPLSGAGAAVSAYTTRQGAIGFEICRPADGDECAYSNGGGNGLPVSEFADASKYSRLAGLGGNLLGTQIHMALDQSSGQIYISNRNRVEAYSAVGQYLRAWGQDVVASGPGDSNLDEQKRLTVVATGGTFTLGYLNNEFFGTPAENTAPIPYDASPATVKAALNDLAQIGDDYSSVSVSGGPGDSTGANPYLITFHGQLGGDDLGEALVSNPNALTSGGGTKSAKVETAVDGGGYEVCEADDACKNGANRDTRGVGAGQAETGGAFSSGVESGPHLAVAPAGAPNAGDVLVLSGEQRRVQEFTPNGTFVRAFGWDVDKTNPSTEFEACTVIAACKFGTQGNGTGQFHFIFAVAEDSSGSIYAVDGSDNGTGPTRVQKFTPGGTAGLTPSLFGTTEIQSLAVNAAAGQFRLTYRGQTTSNLPFDAGAGAIKSALNSLTAINGEGGSVSVTGGPGGSAPYAIAFDGGPLNRADAAEIVGSSGSTPLSGGAGVGANTASVTTPTPGGPWGVGREDQPIAIDTAPGGDVFVAKFFPEAFSTCSGGSPSPDETRIEVLDSSGAVMETSDPCEDGAPRGFRDGGQGLTVNRFTGHPYLLSDGFPARLNIFAPAGPPPDLTLEPVSKIIATGGTISGTINPNGPGTEYPDTTGIPSSYKTTYRVEFKKASDATWTKYSSDTAVGSGGSPVAFSVGVGGLAPKTSYELKVVVVKPFTATIEEARSFTTSPAPPEIEGVSSSDVTATSANLRALINPQGTETTYHFEYGTTPAYGNSTEEIGIGEAQQGQAVENHVEGLQDAVYHFRVVATNSLGTSTSRDQTFTFHPPVCPNQTVRQQTGAAYLPDCRAYELVSPENAAGTMLFTGGPQSPYATNPPRLAFVGRLAAIPNSGRTPINTAGDLYLATRGAAGWSTRYIGPAAEEVGCVGGRPIVSGTGPPTTIQNDVMADPSLGRILDWNLGNPLECVSGWEGSSRFSDFNTAALGSNAPYVWDANGDLLDRWPTSVADVPGSETNLSCPQDPKLHPYPQGVFGNIPVPYFCSTYVDASKDLNHFVFSTQADLYGEGGLTQAPGSAYDNDTVDNTLSLISKLPGGAPIGQEPGAKAGPEELIQFPAISADGSHILMGTATKPACKQVNYPVIDSPPLCPILIQPTHLYMRVDAAVTYDVSAGRPVKYIGSTPDGTKVYFTTNEQLTGDDTDESTDLYMWSENGGGPQLTRVSAGEPDPTGNTDNCVSTWTTNCDVATYDDSQISTTEANRGGLGSWSKTNRNPGYTDNAIAAKSGDIYFYSPEQLVAGRGGPGKENLYVYRAGSVRHVATLEDDPYCIHPLAGSLPKVSCSNGAAGRLQVTPNGRFAAFITTSNVTGYDSHGFAEMYRYDAEAGRVECMSCQPDGSAPNDDVLGSQGGRFITDDGRVFFTTTEPLDPRDTNAGIDSSGQPAGLDVYEFVDGKAQLITTGTGTGLGGGQLAAESFPGLYGVSADGADAYFGTFDTLVGQDRNGQQLKFYDARTNGGFPFVPPPAPCAAADECHGPTSAPPAPLPSGTSAALGAGGNSHKAQKRKHRKRKQQRKQRKRHPRQAAHQRGGAR